MLTSGAKYDEHLKNAKKPPRKLILTETESIQKRLVV